jgi:hypothetical protein
MSKDQIAKCKECDLGFISHAKIDRLGEAKAMQRLTMFLPWCLIIAAYVLSAGIGLFSGTENNYAIEGKLHLWIITFSMAIGAAVPILIWVFLAITRRAPKCSHWGAVIDES